MADYFENGYPPPAFSFRVTIGTASGSADTSFTDVSGIALEMDTETVVEGGENRFVHHLPTQRKHPHLELKRGIASLKSPLLRWCKAVLEGGLGQPIVTETVIVHLLDEKQLPLRTWELSDAWPIKWEVEGFSSSKNEVAVEKIVLAYTCATRTK